MITRSCKSQDMGKYGITGLVEGDNRKNGSSTLEHAHMQAVTRTVKGEFRDRMMIASFESPNNLKPLLFANVTSQSPGQDIRDAKVENNVCETD
jgi:hypothetical protein